MNKEVKEELLRIADLIENEEGISYGEIHFLQCHKQEILDLEDYINMNTNINHTRLCERSGMSEAEYNARKLRMSDKEMFEFIEETLKKSVSEDYAHALALVLFEDVKRNIEETSDVIEVNDTDVKYAIGRVLYERLHVFNADLDELEELVSF